MRASIVLLAAAARLITAQNFAGEPSCAIPCLTAAISSIGCALDDQGCQCTSTAELQAAGQSCLIAGCGAADLLQAYSVGTNLCKSYFATASSAPASTSASVTTTSTPSSSHSSSSPPSSTALSTSSSAATTLSSTSVSSLLGTISSSTTIPVTTSSKAVTPSSGTESASAANSSSSTGAAPHVVAGVGGALGAVWGLIGLL